MWGLRDAENFRQLLFDKRWYSSTDSEDAHHLFVGYRGELGKCLEIRSEYCSNTAQTLVLQPLLVKRRDWTDTCQCSNANEAVIDINTWLLGAYQASID
jgi:hypothetical protein